MSYRRTRAMFIKELHHIVRDYRSLALALAIPVMLLVLFGYALSLDVDRVPILIFDQDKTSASREMAMQFQGSRLFNVLGFVSDYHSVERAIDSNAALMGVVIPRGFGGDLEGGRTAALQILVDGSDSNTSGIAISYVEGVVQTFSARVRAEAVNRRTGQTPVPPIEARTRVWYNSSLLSRNFVVPGLVCVVLMILAGQLTSLTIAREWEMGTMEQILSTPLRPAEMVIGKMLAYFLVGLVDSLVSFVAAAVVFNVPFRGSLAALAFTTCIFLCSAMLWGIFISAMTRSQVAAYQFGILSSFLPGFLLSGFVFSIDAMPLIIQGISHIVPARYFVTIVKDILLKGAGFGMVWMQTLFLMMYACIVFLLAVRKLKQKMA